MANRTPPNQWGALFNFAGGGLVHTNLFEVIELLMAGPTLWESIAALLLLRGTLANRPAATEVPEGTEYFSTDTGARSKAVGGAWVTDSGSGGGSALTGARVVKTNAQTIPNDDAESVIWTTEQADTGDYWAATPDPEIFTIPANGFYLLSTCVTFVLNGDGERMLIIRKIAGDDLARVTAWPSIEIQTSISLSTVAALNAGDEIDVLAYQTSGANLDIEEATDNDMAFEIHQLSTF